MQEPIQPQEKDNKLKYILLGLIFFLICTNGLLIYFYVNNTNEIIDKKKQLKFTTLELIQAKTKVDSMQVQIELRIAQFEELSKISSKKSSQNDSLVKKIKELQVALADIKRIKNNFQKDAGKAWRMYNDDKPKIEGFAELLVIKDQEIATLKKELNYLYQENKVLKHEKVKNRKDVDSLRFIEEALKDKVKIASALEAKEIIISYLNENQKEKDKQPFNAEKITRLKIDFTLAINKVAKVENKTIFLKIMHEDGKMLLDESSGAVTFSPDGKVFTSSQSVMYTRDNQSVTFYYSKGGNYKPGNYSLQLYCEENIIGESSFEIK